jgi:hypothetical protein
MKARKRIARRGQIAIAEGISKVRHQDCGDDGGSSRWALKEVKEVKEVVFLLYCFSILPYDE